MVEFLFTDSVVWHGWNVIVLKRPRVNRIRPDMNDDSPFMNYQESHAVKLTNFLFSVLKFGTGFDYIILVSIIGLNFCDVKQNKQKKL